MFDFVRSHNRVLQVMLGIVIIPVFGFVGLQSYLQPNEAAVPVASVDGHDITHAEWDNQRRIDIATGFLRRGKALVVGRIGGFRGPCLIEARQGVTTGISAADRAHTVRVAISAKTSRRARWSHVTRSKRWVRRQRSGT